MSLSRLLRPSKFIQARAFPISMARALHYANADRDTFDKITSQSDRIGIVDFYADWCGPCRTLTPLLEKLTADPSSTDAGVPFDLVKMDIETDDGRKLAERFKVSAVPTVIAFRDAVPLAQFQGAMASSKVENFLKKLA